MIKFNQIILFARQHRANHNVNQTLINVRDFLLALKIDVRLEKETANYFTALNLKYIDINQLDENNSLIIVIGGDGSLLSAARLASAHNIPVIGINRGQLGFLTDISPQTIEQQLNQILTGKYVEEERFLLSATIHDDKQTYYQGSALNDVVLMLGNEPYMIEFDVFSNNKLISHYRADGFIIATPTGSTAYALSAGGPIIYPNLDVLTLVPMFPHRLNSRPIVIDANTTIDIRLDLDNESSSHISCDGHEKKLIKPGQLITITKQKQKLRLLHPVDYNYYETLRSKLNWEKKN